MKRGLVPAVLGLSVVVSVLMAILRPDPHGHRYDLAIQLTLGLLVIALFLRVPRRRLFSKPVLAAVFVVGLAGRGDAGLVQRTDSPTSVSS